METLLKRQSNPKNRRTRVLDDWSAMYSVSEFHTPKTETESNAQTLNRDGHEGEAMYLVSEEVRPVMYQWVSFLRAAPPSSRSKVEMEISFSIPQVLFPLLNEQEPPTTSGKQLTETRIARGPGICKVEGCGQPRKYRVPRDWTTGACNSTHLRILANRV